MPSKYLAQPDNIVASVGRLECYTGRPVENPTLEVQEQILIEMDI